MHLADSPPIKTHPAGQPMLCSRTLSPEQTNSLRKNCPVHVSHTRCFVPVESLKLTPPGLQGFMPRSFSMHFVIPSA